MLLGIAINQFFAEFNPAPAIRSTHLVQLPVGDSPRDWLSFFIFPSWQALSSIATWRLGVTIALVASLETQLSLEATDKMDPY